MLYLWNIAPVKCNLIKYTASKLIFNIKSYNVFKECFGSCPTWFSNLWLWSYMAVRLPADMCNGVHLELLEANHYNISCFFVAMKWQLWWPVHCTSMHFSSCPSLLPRQNRTQKVQGIKMRNKGPACFESGFCEGRRRSKL